MSPETAIVELRRYQLHPEQRDVLIDLFEERFIESQEELGMRLLGQFVDLDDADSFVWLRGFAGMPARAAALAAFYGGPVWQRDRDRANATMVDSDNVLLLKTSDVRAAPSLPERSGAAEAATGGPIAAVIVPVANTTRALELFERLAAEALEPPARLLCYFVTEESANNFQRLPVREDVRVLVYLVGYADIDALHLGERPLIELAGALAPPAETSEMLRLVPTPRSLLGGASAPCPFGDALLRPVR